MLDDPFELAEDLDTLYLSESNFEVEPSQILRETADQHKLKFNLIQWLAESPNLTIKSQRKQAIANTLNISTRQVERLLKQYNRDELPETTGVQRKDKGKHRISEYWEEFVKTTYEKSIKEKHPLSPTEVVREVKRHAIIELGLEEGDYPHPATIYRVLQPLIEHQNRKKRVRNPGSGSWLAVETRSGQLLKAEFSNQIVQCDHTKLDIRIVGSDGVLLPERPWITIVVDTFSSCVIGYHLWRKQPGSDEVALALRHAMSPKNYPGEYELEKPWQVCGSPLQYFFTDGGKDFRSKHLGYAHAINLDTQDLSLDELKRLNKERSKARKEHSNYDALLALGKRNQLAEDRKQDKKDRQRTEQKQLRQSSKKGSNVVKLRQDRASTSSKKNEPLEILPERISREQIKPQQPEPQPEETLPSTSDAQEQDRHRLVISNRQSKLKRIW